MMGEGACAVLIKQIHSELEKNANNALRQDDLTMSQVTVLMELDRAEGNQMELKQLERTLHVAQSTAAGIVRRLEQKGFVEGFGSPEDKRIKMIRITPTGQACCRKSEANMRKTEENLTAALTETEWSILVSLLQKVRSSFS
ncbi:MAG: MarR family transcriptional regulator [Eubacteriales bacterium]|nr:MarR family transcriptional regulator [Eubacteriales bacterium]